MESSRQNRPRFPVPAGFLGMVGMVLLIELAIGRAYPLETYHIRLDWVLTAERTERDAAQADILCFGDSLVKLAVQPRVLESALGRPVTNLAVVGGQAPSSYFLLQRALRAGARPKAVIVDFAPPLLLAGVEFNTGQWPQLLNAREMLELTREAHNRPLFALWVAHQILPSYDRRERIREHVRSILTGEPWDPKEEGLALQRNTAVNHGALARERNPSNVDDYRNVPAPYRPLPFECQPVNQRYLCKFLKLAQAHGIRVFWLITPSTPSWEARVARRDPKSKFDRGVRQIASAYPNVQVVDGRNTGYGHTVFLDQTHLDHWGAYVFTSDLAAIIDRELRSDRPTQGWLKMPQFQERPPVVELEDLGKSRELVHRVGDTIRR